MIIDVSHASDASVEDILHVSKAPIIASHSSTRALSDHPRNLPDELLKAIADAGGVVQISLISFFMRGPSTERQAAIDSLDQKYGSYFKIKDPEKKRAYERAWYKIAERFASDRANVQEVVDHIDHAVQVAGIDHVGIGSDFDGGGGVIGCDDVSEFPNITVELLRRGYSKKDIKKIWGGNFMRVFREVIAVSRKTSS
jgi:membrane dipeptidase